MAGMLQIITYLLATYLIFKGVEILQIALASGRQERGLMIAIGIVAVIVAIGAGYQFVTWQDAQAESMQHPSSSY